MLLYNSWQTLNAFGCDSGKAWVRDVVDIQKQSLNGSLPTSLDQCCSKSSSRRHPTLRVPASVTVLKKSPDFYILPCFWQATHSSLCMNTVWVAVSSLRPSGLASFCITLLLLDTQDSLVIPLAPHSHFWKICISSSLILSLLLLPISKLFLCVSGIPCIVRKSSSQCLFHLVLTCYLVSKSCPTLLPWTVASQAPPSVGFPRQKYCSGLPFPSPGDLPDTRIKPLFPGSPVLAGGFFTTSVKTRQYSKRLTSISFLIFLTVQTRALLLFPF